MLVAIPFAIAVIGLAAIAGPSHSTASLDPDAVRAPAPPALPDSMTERLTRWDPGEGGTRVSATWITPEYLQSHPDPAVEFGPWQYLVFQVRVDSPRLKRMSAWDLKGMIFLREESGMEYGTSLWRPLSDGTHKMGLIAFPRKNARDNPVPAAGSRQIEIVVRGLAGVPERVLTWPLD